MSVEAVYEEAIANMKVLGIDALVVLGGEGTLTIANEFHKRGVPICGVPKTIDNDLACTELTFGFVTALDIATEALDRLHTTAESHDRVMILEVMGRHAGWIALHSGIAGGADVILIPEIPFTLESVVAKVRARDAMGSNLVLSSSRKGPSKSGTKPVYQDKGDSSRAPPAGRNRTAPATRSGGRYGTGDALRGLGHLQRGGRPNAFDRMLATNFGSSAVRALARGDTGVMVALQAGDVVSGSARERDKEHQTVPPNGQLVRTARDTGVSFGAPNEASYHKSI